MTTIDDRKEKLHRLLAGLTHGEAGRVLLKNTLEEIGYRLLPRVEYMIFPEVTDPARLAEARKGIVLDCETTGLNAQEDSVIQLSMLQITYDDQGIIAVGDSFDAYRDPGIPIPEEITQITGITDAMVAGKVISDEEVAAFMRGADMVVAHNAGFDRKFVEADFPTAGFQAMGWHCSIEQIDWKSRGMKSASLEVLAQKAGFVYDAHNSRSDILATAFILAGDGEGVSPFSEMLAEAAAQPRHILAINSPFDAKDDLKARGYRWAAGGEPVHGFEKVWHRVIPGNPEAMAEEAVFLKDAFRKDVSLPMFAYDPLTRYSIRMPKRCDDFSSRQNIDKWERLKLISDEDPDAISSVQSSLGL